MFVSFHCCVLGISQLPNPKAPVVEKSTPAHLKTLDQEKIRKQQLSNDNHNDSTESLNAAFNEKAAVIEAPAVPAPAPVPAVIEAPSSSSSKIQVQADAYSSREVIPFTVADLSKAKVVLAPTHDRNVLITELDKVEAKSEDANLHYRSKAARRVDRCRGPKSLKTNKEGLAALEEDYLLAEGMKLHDEEYDALEIKFKHADRARRVNSYSYRAPVALPAPSPAPSKRKRPSTVEVIAAPKRKFKKLDTSKIPTVLASVALAEAYDPDEIAEAMKKLRDLNPDVSMSSQARVARADTRAHYHKKKKALEARISNWEGRIKEANSLQAIDDEHANLLSLFKASNHQHSVDHYGL